MPISCLRLSHAQFLCPICRSLLGIRPLSGNCHGEMRQGKLQCVARNPVCRHLLHQNTISAQLVAINFFFFETEPTGFWDEILGHASGCGMALKSKILANGVHDRARWNCGTLKGTHATLGLRRTTPVLIPALVDTEVTGYDVDINSRRLRHSTGSGYFGSSNRLTGTATQ